MITRVAAIVAAVVAALVLVAPALADPAAEALQQGSAYVSPAVGGTGTADAQARLQAVADDLDRAG